MSRIGSSHAILWLVKSSTVRQWVFAFVLGGIVGGFGILASGLTGDDEAPPSNPVSVTAVATRAAARTRGSDPTLDPARDDAALAGDLEQARFESDWGRVQAVAELLRQRTQEAHTSAPVQTQLAKARGASLLKMDQEYRKRAFLLELAKRDNPATRAVALGSIKVQERKLSDLFQAPKVRMVLPRFSFLSRVRLAIVVRPASDTCEFESTSSSSWFMSFK